MYRPNFCAECGAKVARGRWHLWTSRSFCADCAPIFRRGRLLRTLVSCVTIFVLGLSIGRALRPAPPPLIVSRSQMSPAAATRSAVQEETATTTGAASDAPKPEPSYGPDGTATERPTDPAEVVSICGARTQKGTPCQRRVRGTGRCWQHKGMPAMLPPSKLIVQG
jgi:hypothetical protein